MDADERARLCAAAQFGPKRAVRGRRGMAITSHPVATRAAIEVLRDGGNACDAALCASAVQTVVEPHMTTITGMLSMLYRDAASGETTYLNGAPNAPLAALGRFVEDDVPTGRGVAVPGFWAAFEAAAARHGTRTTAQLLGPAIELAHGGFEIHPFLFGDMYSALDTVGRSEQGREIYMPAGPLLRPGDLLVQHRAAQTLERLAADGSEHFYRGSFARNFCETVQRAGGVITREDLERYQVRWQEPISSTFGDWEMVTSPPPDNGGLHLLEALGILECADIRSLGHPTESARSLLLMMRATEYTKRRGDRLNDPQTHPMPLEVLLSKELAAQRLELMLVDLAEAPPGPRATTGSNHVTVVDGEGSIASILHSCLCDFGDNGLFVDGVTICAAGGHFLRAMPQPGHRASIAIAPNIVLREGRPILTSGSPSGSLIAGITQCTLGVLEFGLGLEETVRLPRFGNGHRTGQLIEADLAPAHREELQRRGYPLEVVSPWHYLMGTFEAVRIRGDGELEGCADPRRTGAAEAVAAT